MARASAMKPGSGGGKIQNAKAQSTVRQNYAKSGTGVPKTPAGKPGLYPSKATKSSPLAKRKK